MNTGDDSSIFTILENEEYGKINKMLVKSALNINIQK